MTSTLETEDVVEAVARAIWDHHRSKIGMSPSPFPKERTDYLDWARAALSATPIERLREENARLREVLKPFADEAREYCFEMDCSPCVENADAWADDEDLADTPTKFKCGDLRRAKDAYDAQ
jgi:hypothetical protein